MKPSILLFLLTMLSVSGLKADTIDLIEQLGGELPSETVMVRKGAMVQLDEATQNKVRGAMKTLLETCRADSKTRSSLFRKFNKDIPFDWERATDVLRGTSYLKVTLGKLEKLRAGNKNVYAKYLLLETPKGNWPRKYMVAYDGSTAIQFTRCSGLVMVDLICMPELKDLLPESYAPACRVLPDLKKDTEKAMSEEEKAAQEEAGDEEER